MFKISENSFGSFLKSSNGSRQNNGSGVRDAGLYTLVKPKVARIIIISCLAKQHNGTRRSQSNYFDFLNFK